MNKILSYVRRCVEDYDMIQAGDRVAVGVSGGKDSLTLLVALARLREFYPKPFTVEAYTLDMGHVDGGEGMDFTGVEALCRELDVPFTLLHSEIHHIIFDLRKEKNPCSMCAKMRRGALHNALREHGITKIALGHHFDDAVETFFLSLFYEGRLSCFQPVTYLDRTGITQIRPLLYCGEGMLRNAAERNHLPVVFNPCPADGNTKRQEVKELIKSLDKQYPGLKSRVFGAMQACPCPPGGRWSTGGCPCPREISPPARTSGPPCREGRNPLKNQDFPNGRGGKSRWGLANFRHSPYGESGLARPHPAERMVQHGKQEDLRRVYLPPPEGAGAYPAGIRRQALRH